VAVALATNTAPGDWTDTRELLTAMQLLEEQQRG
jgi:hypothetical protein